MIDNFLESPCSSAVARYIHKFLALDLLQEINSLMNLKITNQLRHEIVPIVISHKVRKMPINLINDFINQWLFRNWKMLLQESGTYFFSGKFINLSIKYLKFLLRIFLSLLNIMLNLLHEFIIWLVALLTSWLLRSHTPCLWLVVSFTLAFSIIIIIIFFMSWVLSFIDSITGTHSLGMFTFVCLICSVSSCVHLILVTLPLKVVIIPWISIVVWVWVVRSVFSPDVSYIHLSKTSFPLCFFRWVRSTAQHMFSTSFFAASLRRRVLFLIWSVFIELKICWILILWLLL